MHLVIGAGEFLGDHVSRTLAEDVPVIQLGADSDAETLTDAMRGTEIVHVCAQSWSPARRLRYRRRPPPLLPRVVEAARHAGVRRIVHVSTADVYGPDHFKRINEKAELKPAHAYEKLKLMEESWLFDNADGVEVVVLRPARVFGIGEDWLLPRLMLGIARGRTWLPGGARAAQTFITAADVGRACLAAAERGRPWHSYLITGFESTWRDFLELAARTLEIPCEIGPLPYDLAFLRGLGEEIITPSGALVWPGVYAVDVIGKPHQYDDSFSRRELTWSPATGSFEQEMPLLAPWLSTLVAAGKSAATQSA
ncbi:MAG TPA: NAD-dependent epimerase/dehydratase family protein [Candidatus Dormibacteraeota bacterium]|nr:NAD-dependent epimerase/dehydratase family protein [Candidatus Dormibacteraeota bacterium]